MIRKGLTMKTIICLILLGCAAFGAEHVRNPLTDAEKAKIGEIKTLHTQVVAKRMELLEMLRIDHPKMAERIENRVELRHKLFEAHRNALLKKLDK
jgi:hypothetical protein